MRAREFVTENLNADQVLDYVNRLHHDFDIEYSITDHPEWELKNDSAETTTPGPRR